MGAWSYRYREYRGAAAWELDAQETTVVVLPDFGGRIASLRRISGNGELVELLLQPRSRRIALPRAGARYSGSFSWGWDDLFPTVAPCSYGLPPYEDLVLADHGDIWSSAAEPRFDSSGCVTAVLGRTLPYRLERTLAPIPGGIRLEWKLENLSDRSLSYLWAAHPLFAAEGDAAFSLPGGDTLTEYENPAGVAGRSTKGGLVRMPEAGERSALKYFFRAPLEPTDLPLLIHRPSAGITLRLDFDLSTLSFLGVWLNARGWERQYVAALEPCTAFPDSLADAVRNGTARVLPPLARVEWWMELTT